MKKSPLYAPQPYFVLTAFFAFIPVLNHAYPWLFYPSVPRDGVDILSVLAGIFTAFKAFNNTWAILQFRLVARNWISQVVADRKTISTPDPNDVVNAGRTISRLVRNVDEDLKEIEPDFTMASLRRLNRYFPELLMEIDSQESGRIRLGIVGTYIGETLCRAQGWEWFFAPDVSLSQFSFLTSVIRKNGKTIDPFEVASRGFFKPLTLDPFDGDLL